ncbi:hypothetical protein [Abiotrophia defectiva]|nr:hypothetical protein [Abiotrophia defectiva]
MQTPKKFLEGFFRINYVEGGAAAPYTTMTIRMVLCGQFFVFDVFDF